MITLVVGATGATGRLLVRQLLDRDASVRAIVRSPGALPDDLRGHARLSVIQAAVLDLADTEMARHVQDCDAVASCLGHNPSFQGLFGHPRRLVTDATRRLCQAIQAGRAGTPTKFVLMNTNANRNRDLDERISLPDRAAIGLIRLLLPPQVDNEKAAEHLRTGIGNDTAVEWAAVRPDALFDEQAVTEYEVVPSPTRGIIFNSGKTSRINVAHFMAELITDPDTWSRWRGRMPVIYNRGLS